MAWFSSYSKRRRGFFFDNVFKSFSLGGTTIASETTNDDDETEVLTTNNLHADVMANITSVGTLGNVTVTNTMQGGNIRISGNNITNYVTGQPLTLSAPGGSAVVIDDSLTVNNDAVITGSLTVNGTTTTVNTTNTTIADPLYILNNGQTGTPTKDSGFVIERGSSNNVAWVWDESADKFMAVETSEDGTTAGDISIIGYADMQAKDITATSFSGDGSALTGIAQAQITQHQAALSITESQISDLSHYANSDVDAHLNQTNPTSGHVLSWNGSDYAWIDNAGYDDSDVTSYLTTATGATQTGDLTVLASSTIEFNENKLGNIGTPVASTDGATKGYVDSQMSSFSGDSFSAIAVSGQSTLNASGATTLTFAAGTGTAIATDASTDTVTITVEQSIFGGVNDEDLGLVTDSVTQSEDLGDFTTHSNSENLGAVVALEGVAAPSQLILPEYETASRPDATVQGQLIYNSTLDAVQFSNGTEWDGYAGTASPTFTGTITAADLTASGTITGANFITAGAVTATGNISGAYIIGDGSQLTGMPVGYTDSDVTSLLSDFGSSPITTTGTITGKISSSSLQVVSTVYTGKTTYSVATAGSTGTYIAVLDTAITPTKTSSKVRVEFNISFEVHHDTIFRLFRVIGGTTTEVRRNDDGNYWSGFAYPGYDVDNGSTPRTNHYIYIDSPNTTSAVTYKLMIQSAGVGATTLYLNRTVGSTGGANHENAISQCILTEIPV